MKTETAQYKVLRYYGPVDEAFGRLEYAVNNMVADGWIPLGGMSFALYAGGCQVAQAIMLPGQSNQAGSLT